MSESDLSSHIGSSISDSYEAPSKRMKDFDDLPQHSFELGQEQLKMLSDSFREIKAMLVEYKVQQEWISEVIVRGLDKWFDKSCPLLVKKGKQFFGICLSLFCQKDKKPQKHEEKVQEVIKIEEKPEKKTIKKVQVRRKADKPSKEPKQKIKFESPPSVKSINSSNIYALESLSDEIEQKNKSELSPSIMKALEKMTYNVIWEKSNNFDVDEGTITKIIDHQYRKICSKDPLQGYSTYKFKFRVIKMGTIAFGLVPAQSKWGYYVDDRKHNVFKYIAFENGGTGIIKLNKQELEKSSKFHLEKDSQVEFQYDQKNAKVTIKTTNMNEKVIQTPSLMGLNLHLYVEMKQEGTCIQFM